VDSAAQAYETALALDPDHVDAHFNLALLWEKVGIRKRALAHWQRVLALSADVEARSLALRFSEDETDR
jgi:predicted TPR repeat methyltransferase